MSHKDESRIRTDIAENLRSSGGSAIVFSGSMKQAAGTPDILGTIWGRNCRLWLHYGIEVKTESGAPSLIQIEILKRMAFKGYLPIITTNLQHLHSVHKQYDLLMSTYGDYAQARRLLKQQFLDEYKIW